MILADTSIWISHLRENDPAFADRLAADEVLMHPFVVGELSMGNLRGRADFLDFLSGLTIASQATDAEVRRLVEDRKIFGRGLGYVDAHLLAATLLTPDAKLLTRDRRLAETASELGVAT